MTALVQMKSIGHCTYYQESFGQPSGVFKRALLHQHSRGFLFCRRTIIDEEQSRSLIFIPFLEQPALVQPYFAQ